VSRVSTCGFGTAGPLADTSRRSGADLPANSLVSNLSLREIPNLNGLRGGAALAVVVYHYTLHSRFMSLFPGPYAVTLFFELSGLLITWLLLKEIDETGHLDKRQFYFRRALRLFPVFYVVWALCRLAGPFQGSWAVFFYMGDYYHAFVQRYSMLTVAWSLGVEEKFYLLWPFVLTRIKRNKLIRILVGVLIAEPVYRSVLTLLGYQTYTWFAFDCHLDAIVLGCLIALVVRRGWIAPAWLSHPYTPFCGLILVFALQRQSDIVTYLLAAILVSAISRPSAILNHRVARYLGAISYSLYLCHGYARDVLWPRITGSTHLHDSFVIFVAQLALAIAVASVLHFAIERPFLLLKNRFHASTRSKLRVSTIVPSADC
jgi:peptidoglycan/LPS O-acetylase OafA/YrhL